LNRQNAECAKEALILSTKTPLNVNFALKTLNVKEELEFQLMRDTGDLLIHLKTF